ncbi:hypothetical protein QL285_008808 [Trifolium repens]|jgi:hypothetical protein|nr:hypothetical protein QL285_008808 [Trifolium repens]
MNPLFIEEIYRDLSEEIILIDRTNRRLKVQYNQAFHHPLIINGWSKMTTVFGITRNQFILFTYVGENKFVLDFLPDEFQPNKLPNYHSYKYHLTDPISFNVTLTQHLASGSELVRQP